MSGNGNQVNEIQFCSTLNLFNLSGTLTQHLGHVEPLLLGLSHFSRDFGKVKIERQTWSRSTRCNKLAPNQSFYEPNVNPKSPQVASLLGPRITPFNRGLVYNREKMLPVSFLARC